MFEHFCLDRSADSPSLGPDSTSQHGGSSGPTIIQPLQQDTSGDSSAGSGLALASSSIFSTMSHQSSNSSAPAIVGGRGASVASVAAEESAAPPQVNSRVSRTNINVHRQAEVHLSEIRVATQREQLVGGNWGPPEGHEAVERTNEPSQDTLPDHLHVHEDFEWLERWEEFNTPAEQSNLDELLKDITYSPVV